MIIQNIRKFMAIVKKWKNVSLTDSESFKFKLKITEKYPATGNTNHG